MLIFSADRYAQYYLSDTKYLSCNKQKDYLALTQRAQTQTNLSPVVQNIVSLMSLLRGQLFKCFTL